MEVMTKPRNPKWIIVSAYIGPKKKFKGLIFPTRFTYYRRKIADVMVRLLNQRAGRYSDLFGGPGRDFEFRVIPYEADADSPKEV